MECKLDFSCISKTVLIMEQTRMEKKKKLHQAQIIGVNGVIEDGLSIRKKIVVVGCGANGKVSTKTVHYQTNTVTNIRVGKITMTVVV